MRPIILQPLFADIEMLPGIGAKLSAIITTVVRPKSAQRDKAIIADLILTLPNRLVDRRYVCKINQLPVQGTVTVEVTVDEHRAAKRKGMPYRVLVSDETGTMELSYFKTYGDSLLRLLPVGQQRLISGDIDWFNATPQMPHPDYVIPVEAADQLPLLEPIYPLTSGLSPKAMRKAITLAIQKLPPLPEWQDTAWLTKMEWPGFNEALRRFHAPTDMNAFSENSPERQRLAFDELLASQLALLMVRRFLKRAKGASVKGTGNLRQKIIASLPFALTGAQTRSIEDILADMAAPLRMLRLLQGDVGSGKTIVALLAIAAAVEAGFQGALMAPTEILARQHFETLKRFGEPAGLRIALLTGREKGNTRTAIETRLQTGEIDILVGTHALFQDNVSFHKLGLAVIDEQHRFGVHQRLALQAKADHAVDILAMTATPIPRTLALTLYGDMDISKLDEKPAGRKAIETSTIPMSRLADVVAGIARKIKQGDRVYWVCPLIEESEFLDVTYAEKRFEDLQQAFPGRVGIVHGRLKNIEKDQVIEYFRKGEIDILVATTVVEVGVDVPHATVMVIENAERFGLSQLHQLRGRVGRSDAQSHCILLYQEPAGEMARARLTIMRETDDGFRIAEEDLRLRGAGEVLGTQQSGLPAFRLADPVQHANLLVAASHDAQLILDRDPDLRSSRGEALRHLLYLFERDEAVRLLDAG